MFWIPCAVLFLAVAGYVLTPLFKGTGVFIDETETEADLLRRRKLVVYRNIKDLEFEHRIGRLSGDDFSQLNESYRREAAEILQKLDQLKETKPVKATSGLCRSCGAQLIPGKKFCADCGTRRERRDMIV